MNIDSGKIAGVKIYKEDLRNWINKVKQSTSPSVIPDMIVVEIDGKTIVVIEVKEYPIKPVSFKNRYFLRKANSNHIMSMEEIANEYLKTKNSSWDYYIDTIREIVLNMIVHRDYRDSSDSVIKIFDDRIEFFNPGDLYDDLTIEQLMSNHYESKTRNKLIALMFKECGLIEKYGSGISRIQKLCEGHGLKKPKFEEIQKGFKVTIYKKTAQENTREKIIHLLRENPKYTKQDLMQKLNKADGTIKEHLSKLKKEGVLHRVGSTKSGYWKVKSDV